MANRFMEQRRLSDSSGEKENVIVIEIHDGQKSVCTIEASQISSGRTVIQYGELPLQDFGRAALELALQGRVYAPFERSRRREPKYFCRLPLVNYHRATSGRDDIRTVKRTVKRGHMDLVLGHADVLWLAQTLARAAAYLGFQHALDRLPWWIRKRLSVF